MHSSNSSIIVASFATQAEVHIFANILIRLAYEPQILPGSTWLDDPLQYPCPETVLFFGSADYQRRQLLTALDKLETRPSLVIFRDDEHHWDPAILLRCQKYLAWPCDEQVLASCLERVLKCTCDLPSQIEKSEIFEKFACFNMIGASPAFLDLLKLIKKVAQYDAPVLIEGETGTGKELTAHALHYLGKRRDYPFIPVNCGAVPDNLVENELFGHEKGAFTDATAAQKGLVAQAHGGTLFLDEVETLSAKAQVALLRFLQDHEYRPLGSKYSQRAELRLIAANNSDLRTLVNRGEFRQDLFFRLNVISLRLPPLRERLDDIEVLAKEFIRQTSARYEEPTKVLHPDTLAWMERYDWPGNIRELENFIHHAFLTSEDRVIHVARHPAAINHQKPGVQPGAASSFDKNFKHAKAEVIRDFEKRYLSWLIAETRGNITLAAQRAGKDRRAIGKLLKKYGIDRNRFS